MRNLILLQDSIYSGLVDQDDKLSNIVSICRDIGSTSVFTLTDSGYLSIFKISDQLRVENQLSLCTSSGEKVNSWFDATVVGEIGAVVCISHSGTIISVREDPETGRRSDTFEQEGDVDGGIAAAGWNPDASNLAIVTNNDSILLMTAYWDVLEEVPMPSRLPGSPCSVSWRGDGEYLTILCVDKELLIPQVRVYSKKLELISIGRNVAEGAGSLLRGLGSAVAYATNGSLIALSQQQGKSKLQIAFIEKNGLRHLEFDVHVSKSLLIFLFGDFKLYLCVTLLDDNYVNNCPFVFLHKKTLSQCPNKPEGSSDWEVSTLHWDLPSTLLAVGLSR
jgi:IKI3 family